MVSVLSCRTGGRTPWLWTMLYADGDALSLGESRPVHVAVDDSDTLLGSFAGVHPDPGPHQWVDGP